jgi:hypothetical protein
MQLLFISGNWRQKLYLRAVDSKKLLAAKLLKLNIKAISDVFGSSSTSFLCVYLLSLGKVKTLRNTFNISVVFLIVSFKYICRIQIIIIILINIYIFFKNYIFVEYR